MAKTLKIIGLSGSLRRESYTSKLLLAFQRLAPSGVSLDLVSIGDLPFINEDLEGQLPDSVQNWHRTIEESDGVLFATPEYNRSYSPVLKNAIDWGSRPDGYNAWDGKPAGVLGSTLYNLGTFGAQQHLRQVLMYLNLPTLQQPEFYLERSAEKFAPDGTLTDLHTEDKIGEYWEAFEKWARRFASTE